LQLADDTNLSIIFCVWGQKELNLSGFNSDSPLVIAVKNAKASDFGTHSLNSNDESEIRINPDIE